MITELVKVYFHNGTGVEGKLVSLTDKELILHSTESKEQLLILNPQQNILMIKTISSNIKDTKLTESKSNIQDLIDDEESDVEDDEEEVELSPLSLKAKSVAELKAMEAKAEAEKIAANLKKQEILDQRKPTNYQEKYGSIDLTKFGSKKPTTKKDNGHDGKNRPRMSKLFKK